jgi:L-ascorbate metabolism protein UlaG (beta-lactamase superfamily)
MKRAIPFFLFINLVMVWVAGCKSAATAVPTPLPPTVTTVPATPTLSVEEAIGKLHWFGTSAILYNGSKVIYFDPISLGGNLPKADIILVTHAHSDHWSLSDVKKIIGPNTTLIVSPNVSSHYEAAKSDLGIPAIVLAEGQTAEVNGISIQAVPAYGSAYGKIHPREAGGAGYIVSIDGIRLYEAGGTDAYPDMAKSNCDIAFINLNSNDQNKTMAQIIQAKVIIFVHTSYYGAKAVADLFNQSIGGRKIFMAMEAGPNNP